MDFILLFGPLVDGLKGGVWSVIQLFIEAGGRKGHTMPKTAATFFFVMLYDQPDRPILYVPNLASTSRGEREEAGSIVAPPHL